MWEKWTKWQRAEMVLFAGPVTLVTFVVVIGSTLMILMWGFSNLFIRSDPVAPRAHCNSNLQQMAMAVMLYQQDTYGYWPSPQNSRSGLQDRENWVGKIYPFARSDQIFQCPFDRQATDRQKSSYGYNARLNKGKIKIKHPVSVVLLFEVEADADNSTQTGTGIQAVSAHMRHLDGANYAFADGHVKWLQPQRVNGAKPDGENFTFAVE